MMEKKVIVIVCLCIFSLVSSTTNAQSYSDQNKYWVLGVGFNVIYDSGERLDGLFDFENNYHYRTPIRISAERRWQLDFGFEAAFNYNKFVEGKVQNLDNLSGDVDYLSLDTNFKYYFSNLFVNTHRSNFESFLAGGFGQNLYNGTWTLSFNTGLGMNYYLTDNLLLTAQGLFKFTIIDPLLIQDFLYFNAGIIFKLPKRGNGY